MKDFNRNICEKKKKRKFLQLPTPCDDPRSTFVVMVSETPFAYEVSLLSKVQHTT